MKQHIAVFTLGLSLLTSCMTDSAYRKVENGLVADIRSGQAKAVKLEVISDDIIRVIASPDGKFSNQVNLIKDTKSLPAPIVSDNDLGGYDHRKYANHTGPSFTGDRRGSLYRRQRTHDPS